MLRSSPALCQAGDCFGAKTAPRNDRHFCGIPHAIMGLERFCALRDDVFFKTVTVDAGGYGVSWNDEVDLSEYELWHNGAEPGRGLEQRDIALYQAGR